MPLTQNQQLETLGDYLGTRRAQILRAWRKAADNDSRQTTAHALSPGQFHDHIPWVLDAFEQKLRSRPGGASAAAPDIQEKKEEVKHGLHRWQQGYRLQELMHEWGHLQLCLLDEMETFASRRPEFETSARAEANRRMITLVNDAISESTGQYERMERAEAAGHVDDLMGALTSVNNIERRRTTLIHQAVHDLSSNVHSVSLAASLLGESNLAAARRTELASLLHQGTQVVTAMLGDLMDLARLEAGQERREIAAFDAAALVTEVCNFNEPVARQHGLYLRLSGSPAIAIEGDSGKVRRLLQNLLRNALKYTDCGGVSVSWGVEEKNWWMMVKDTGPGMMAGPDAPMLTGLKEATESAREADETEAASKGEVSQVLVSPPGSTVAPRTKREQPGEGIGLSIVKRLCELLDASLEVASSAEAGTTLWVVFPKRYPSPGKV
ncbi:MAG: HAMP domain-containing histidine kinase [Undibacterium sp.]|nr:HAMP domain-containing histidine kinase [Opitutaceae bacterium]